ncbi:MAG TPA: DUF1275 family protein [Stellaceae bacterium]|nr:DUF1275 family protein [Stellaceae bacterium]
MRISLPVAAWAAILLVAAMGVQNPVAARFGVPINPTFITGDILRFAEGLARRWQRAAAAQARARALRFMAGFGSAMLSAPRRVWRLCASSTRPLIVPAALLALVYAWNRVHASP